MVVSDASIHNIMGGMESTGGVRLHNHRRKLKQRFDIIKKLGQGTYGKVQLGINKETGQEVAIKTIKKAKIETEADLVRIRREIQIMSSVQHPNIIHIYEVFENREKMVLVMEYAAGGELYDYLSERKVLSEDEARRIFRQISTAVYYCHKHKICHRDLKLENILLDEHGSAKIADFGLSNVFDEQRLLNTFCGSPLYASPEIVKGTPYHGPEVDCWSLGVLLYTLVYGAMPFDGSNFKRLVRQISQGDYFEPKKPSPASPLIREMLTVTPGRRADIEKICSHWWVNEGYGESCLEIAEELANQTPVRLDLLLSLAPPAPNVGSDKLLVGAEQDGGATGMGNDVLSSVPARCHSVGSLMELDHRPSDVSVEDVTGKDTAKRKLEGGISTEEANRGASKRKERSRRSTRERSSERHRGRSSSRSKQKSDSVSTDEPMEVDSGVVDVDHSLQGSGETIVGSVKTATSSVDTIAGSSAKLDEGLETLTSGTPKNRTGTDLVKDLEESETLLAENECSAVAQDNAQVLDDEGESAKIKVKRKKKVVSESKGVAEDSGPQVMDQVKLDSASVADSAKVPTVCDTMNSDSTVAPEAAVQNSMVGDHVNVDASETASSVGELDVSGVSVNSSSAAVSSPVDIPKKLGTKTRRSKGELSLGKMGSGSEKSSGANTPEDTASPPSKPVERRRSKIFETAEKFNMLAGVEPKSPTSEKPKKVFIPGVKVSDAKRAFEKKSSSAVSVPSLAKSSSSKKTEESKTEICDVENYESTAEENKASLNNKAAPPTKAMNGEEEIVAVQKETNAVINETSKKLSDLELNDQPAPHVDDYPAVLQKEDSLKFIPPLKTSEKPNKQEEARIKKLKDAVEIISNAITEGHRKEAVADNTKKGTATKPPVPVPQELKTKTKTINITTPVSPKSPPLSPVDLQTVSERRTDREPESNDYASGVNADTANKKKSSKVEITLKSATLPRRKTSKAEIRLNSPNIAPVGFHTEVSHMIEPAELTTQRSQATFPVTAAAPKQPPRSVSLEPEGRVSKPREHIIPIRVEEGNSVRPPVAPTQQRVYTSQRSGSLSRQSTQDSDTDSTVSVGPEPIRKSPREYIIPIAVEGGGYVTPRAGSLEPSVSDENNTKPRQRKTSRFGRHRRMSGLLSDASEDEGFNSPFATLQRHSSLNRDKDPETPEEEKGAFHMHRLRSSRPNRSTLERNDSLSSAEDDDDDDGFEILTAESLFSTLLSRVRSLTQRLNVEDGARPGFPTSTLMSQLKNVGRTPPSRFWSSMGEPLSRRLSETSHFSRSFSRDQDIPWRRSASRDVSDSGSVYSDNSGTVPRGAAQPGGGSADGELCAAESAAASSCPSPSSSASSLPLAQYTPSLSRRILPDAGRRLSRTSSVREERPAALAPPRWSPQVDASLPPAPRRSGSGSSCGSLPPLPLARRRTLLPPVSYRPRERLSVAGIDDTLERIRAERSAAGLGVGSGATATATAAAGEAFADRYRPGSHVGALSRFPRRSASFTQDYDYGRRSFDTGQDLRRGEVSSATSPDRSVLGKFLHRDPHQQGSSAREPKTAGVAPETAATSEGAEAKKKTRKISRFLRPDFFDTPREESVYAKEKEAQKSAEAEAKKAKRLARRAALLEKKQAELSKEANTEAKPPDGPVPSASQQPPSDAPVPEPSGAANGKPESTKNRFLHSLEKKLEKLRSSGGDAAVPSRVEQAINSLRKQSATTDVPSESALLKRAVSVDDVRLPPSARPVSSVLGLLRRMESSPGRRTQSVYAGATSDTVLDCVVGEKLKPEKKKKEPVVRTSLGTVKPSIHETMPAVSGDIKTKRDDKKQQAKDSDQTDGKRQTELKTPFVDQHNFKKERVDDKKPNADDTNATKNAATTSGKSTSKVGENTKSSTPASLSASGTAKCNDTSNICDAQTTSAGTRSTGTHRQSAVSKVPLAEKEENISKNNCQNVKNNDAITRPAAEATAPEQTSFSTKRAADQKAQYNKINETVRPVLRDDTYNCTNHVTGIPTHAPRPSKISSNALAAGNLTTLEPIKHHLEQGESTFNDLSVRRDIGRLALNLPKIELQGTNHCSHLSPLGQEDYASTLSPADESESIDSWSVCSDLDSRDFSLSSFPKTPSPVMEDESVEERIRRKSFYTRFNDIRRKSHRKSSSGHLLGLKESVSRKSSFSDAPSLATRPKKATRSQSLYNPSEIEAFTDSKTAAYGSESVMEGMNNTNAATSSTGTLQNGCGKKESDPSVVLHCERDPQFSASAQDRASRETSRACPEINGQKEFSVEIPTDNHRIPTVSRSKLPTLDKMKKGEVAGAKFKANK